MTVIKICGLRRLEDAVILNREKVDAAGFVFYPPSRRFVRPELAGKIKKLLYPSIRTVGVFVKEDPERVVALHKRASSIWPSFTGMNPPMTLLSSAA